MGISCGFTTDVYSTLWTAQAVRQTIPGTPVFVGGHHASLIPGDFLFPGSPVDAVVIGKPYEKGHVTLNGDTVTLSDDDQAKSVTARMLILATDTATYRKGYGCVLQPWDS